MKTKEEWIAARRERWAEAFELVERGEASKRVEQCCELVLRGYGIKEIADRLVLGKTTVGGLLKDPTGKGADARRHKRHGICLDCGAKTFNGGAKKLPKRCFPCSNEHKKMQTKERVVAAIQEWESRYGMPPSAYDWNLHYARAKAHPERLRQIEARHGEAEWPNVSTVQAVFGSWNNALREAGVRPIPPGQRRDPESWRKHLEKIQ